MGPKLIRLMVTNMPHVPPEKRWKDVLRSKVQKLGAATGSQPLAGVSEDGQVWVYRKRKNK